MSLKDRVVVVTGASRGIGKAIAIAFGGEGASVVVNYVQASSEAEGTAEAIRQAGGQAITVQADVSQASDVERLMERAEGQFGPLDMLVNNAGVVVRKPFLATTEQDLDWQLAINVKGVFLPSRWAAKRMVERRSGVIINVSSINGSIPEERRAIYNASKAAVTMLTKSMALELAPFGVRVNAIAPGVIDNDPPGTPMNAQRYSFPVWEWVPLGARLGRPEECAAAVVFLASDAASYITGHVLGIDGGLSCRQPFPMPQATEGAD